MIFSLPQKHTLNKFATQNVLMHKRKFKYGVFKKIQRSSMIDPNFNDVDDSFAEWLCEDDLFEDSSLSDH